MSQSNGDAPPKAAYYVAKYDFPEQGITAGQVFRKIDDVPPNIPVAFVPVGT